MNIKKNTYFKFKLENKAFRFFCAKKLCIFEFQQSSTTLIVTLISFI